MAHSKKTTKCKTKQKPAKAAPLHILKVVGTEERAQKIAFNHRVYTEIHEDLLDRL